MFIKVLAPGYYARQDTKTPVKIGIKAMVANMAFNLMLAPILGYVGLALATTLSATLNAMMLYRGLKKEGVYQLPLKTIIFIIKLMLACWLYGNSGLSLSPEFEIWLTFSFMNN